MEESSEVFSADKPEKQPHKIIISNANWKNVNTRWRRKGLFLFYENVLMLSEGCVPQLSECQRGDINRTNDADWLTESITALIYQRHEIAFAFHPKDIQFQTTVGCVRGEGGEFRVAWSCHHYLNWNQRGFIKLWENECLTLWSSRAVW